MQRDNTSLAIRCQVLPQKLSHRCLGGGDLLQFQAENTGQIALACLVSPQKNTAFKEKAVLGLLRFDQ